MLIKILGIGVATVVINIVLKQYKPEFAILANICGGLLIFMLISNQMGEVIESFAHINDLSGIKLDIVSPIMKVIGIGYITEFAADLAEDSGNKNIADKIIVGGKVAICLLAMPIVKSLIQAIISII